MNADTFVSLTLLAGMSGLILVFVPIADGIYRVNFSRDPRTVRGRRQRRYDRIESAVASVGGLLLMVFVAGVARLAGLL